MDEDGFVSNHLQLFNLHPKDASWDFSIAQVKVPASNDKRHHLILAMVSEFGFLGQKKLFREDVATEMRRETVEDLLSNRFSILIEAVNDVWTFIVGQNVRQFVHAVFIFQELLQV